MHSLAEYKPEDRPDLADPALGPSEPARVIEIGEVTAGIAVPEGRGVRFVSSARDFDGLDGAVFRTAEQAARFYERQGWARDGRRKERFPATASIGFTKDLCSSR